MSVIDDKVRSGEQAMAFLRPADGKRRVIKRRWHTGLGRRVLRLFVAIVLTPLILPVAIFVVAFRRDR